MGSSVKPVEVLKIQAALAERKADLLAVEEPMEIRLGHGPLGARQQKSLSVTMRTPGQDFELALGFLYTEGVVSSLDQIESLKYCENVGRQEDRENVVRVELKPDVRLDLQKLQRNFYTTSSCGVCGKSSIDAVKTVCSRVGQEGFQMDTDIIYGLSDRLRKAQQVFEYTGGLHAMGLFTAQGELELLREDVGRHNALDKAIGAALSKGMLPLSRHLLFISGRASFELVQKAAMAGIPCLAAVGAPSSLAVALAESFGMTLLGFVRDQRFNVYCGESRLLRAEP